MMVSSGVTRVDFYHLQKWSIERALLSLLEKIYSAKHRAVLLSGSSTRIEALTALLWTYTPDSWLPHGSITEGYGDATLQPIWLTTIDENPNKANVLILIDGMDSAHKAQYWRCLDLFDGNDSAAVASAHDRWQACRNSGFVLFYWQQHSNKNSKWELKERS